MSMRTTLIQTPGEGNTQARADTLLTGAFGEGFTTDEASAATDDQPKPVGALR